MKTAAICTIGDEILIGQIVDTNSSYISRALGEELGIRTNKMISIGDNHETIIAELDKALRDNDVVIITGGLGPTKDDITKAALAELSGSSKYRIDEGQKAIVTERLHSRGLDVLESNIRQAEVPEKCEVLVNEIGTAPNMVFRFPEGGKYGHSATLYSLPGVPHEAINALKKVVNDIKQHFGLQEITHKTIMTYGIAESALAKTIEEWENALPDDIKLAYLPNFLTGVRLRLSCYSGDNAEMRINEQIETLKPLLKDYIYAYKDSCLEAEIGTLLKGTGKTLCAAESCTGGMISHLLTTISGSSEYYLGSITSYSPKIKNKLLGVSYETINTYGIVSSQVAQAMAEGARKLMDSTYAVATTGWADSYGDEHEPAGTVWVAVSGPNETRTARFNYKNERKRNIERFAASALNELRKLIEADSRP